MVAIIPGQSKDAFIARVRRVVGDELELTVLEHHDGITFDAKTPLFDAICGDACDSTTPTACPCHT